MSATVGQLPGKRGFDLPSLLKAHGSLLAFVVLFTAASLRYDKFFTLLNLTNISRQVSMLGLVATGMTFVILTGGIDLSVGSILAVSGVIAAKLSGYGLMVALPAALLVAALLGLINGLFITRLKIVPFIATLAMMIAARGLAYISTGEATATIEKLSPTFRFLARGNIGIVPFPALLFLSVLCIFAIVAHYSSFGQRVYAVGGNEEAARMMGLGVDGVKLVVYSLNGLMAGLAGVIVTSRLGAGQSVAGEGWEMTTIAAVVVGGTHLAGGVGGFGKTLIGVLTIGTITNIINLQGNVSSWWHGIIMGGLLLMVVIIQSQATGRARVR